MNTLAATPFMYHRGLLLNLPLEGEQRGMSIIR